MYCTLLSKGGYSAFISGIPITFKLSMETTMTFKRRTVMAAAAALALFSSPQLWAQAQPIKIFNVVELSGTGATAGTMFKSGIELAVKDINASGGILGRKIEVTNMDT